VKGDAVLFQAIPLDAHNHQPDDQHRHRQGQANDGGGLKFKEKISI
jgi:hypothetical protein